MRVGFFLSIVFLIVVLTLSIEGFSSEPPTSTIQSTGIDANLRGVDIGQTNAGKYVIWASGNHGTILRSNDEGKTWNRLKIAEETDLDFRDIEVFGENTAYAMSSGPGEKSRIYKTIDGGKIWTLQYLDKRKDFFLDAMDCPSRTHCYALSDPVDGKFVVLQTNDGRHWKELPRGNMPHALAQEGAFAASGTSIAVCKSDIYFGTGGPAARLFHSSNSGASWAALETPIASGKTTSGIFSVACNGRFVVAVGGDYKDINNAGKVAAYSNDRGKTWHLSNGRLGGFRSCVRIASGETIAVGPNGEDISLDYGISWKPVDTLNLNAVSVTPGGLGWAVGPNGTYHHFQLKVLDSIRNHRYGAGAIP